MQNSLLVSAILLGATLLTGRSLSASEPEPNSSELAQRVLDAKIHEAPLTVSMSTVGLFTKGCSWYLSVNSAGHAELTVNTLPKPTRRQFVVSAAQQVELRKLLLEQGFFELAEEYGESVPDGSTVAIAITAGDLTKSLKLKYLGNNQSKLAEANRAVRVASLIRDWFDDSEAVDRRESDKKALDRTP